MTGHNTGGLHIEVVGSHNGYGDYLRRCADAGKPVSMVKAFFDGGSLMEAKSVSPQTVTIWRGRPLDGDSDNPHPEQDWLWDPSLNEQYADEWMMALLERWQYDRDVTDYLEIVNEPNGGGNPLQFENQRDFFVCCMQWADAHNFKIAIGSFSSGCPTEWQTQILAPSFDYAARYGHIVALHDGSVDGDRPLFSQAAEDGTAYRYRMFNHVLDSMGLMRPRYAITEGYRPNGYRGMNAASWADMQAYLQELSKDGVLGWAWFTLGDYDFGGGIVNVVGQLPHYTDVLIATDWPDESLPPEPEPVSPVILKVPYLPQTSINANLSYNDCGSACEAMIARYLIGDTRTVNDWYLSTGAGPGLITIPQMKLAAQHMGYTLNVLQNQSLASLRAALDNSRPCILLVNPVGLRACGTTAPHFIIGMGYSKESDVFYCHDPYFLGGGIGGAMIEQPTLAEAWSRCHEQGNPDWLMMTMDAGTVPPPPVSTTWRGLQLRNGDNTTDDWNCVMVAKLDAVKFTTDTNFDDLGFACALVPPSHILLRLFADMSSRVVAPVEFASWFGLWLDKFASVGGQYVEVHNEPNLYAEGLGQSWQDGATFGTWLIAVLAELWKRQPDLKYGFPGLSPGGAIEGVRMDEAAFYDGARSAAAYCDWIGVHCYWLSDEGMNADGNGGHYRLYADEDKPLIITEFSNPSPDVPKEKKGKQYKVYYASLPKYVISAYAFISSAENQKFQSETWVNSDIPEIVGS